jgi:PAS domain S-box-containing protein
VLLPLAAGACGAMWAARRALREGVEGGLRGRADALALLMEAEISRAAPELRALGSSPMLGVPGNEEDLGPLYERARHLAHGLGAALRMRGPGPEFALRFHTSFPFDQPPPLRLQPVFRQGLERAEATGDLVVSDLTTSTTNGRPLVMLAVPVLHGDQVIGTLSASIEPPELSRRLASSDRTGSYVATLFDSSSTVVARSRDAERFVGQRMPEWLVARRGDDSGIRYGPNIDGDPSVIAFHVLQAWPGWTLAVVASEAQFNQGYSRPFLLLLSGGMLALLLAVVGGLIYSKLLLLPLQRLIRIAEQGPSADLSPDSKGARFPRVAEFEALSVAMLGAGQALQREALKARRERALLRSVLDSSADAVFVKDREGRYLVVNTATAENLGQPLHLVVGRTDRELWPAAASAFTAVDRQVLNEGRIVRSEIIVPASPGRPRRVFLAIKSPWRDPQSNEIVGVAGVAHDITERSNLEDKLRQAEAKVHLLARRSTMDALAAGIAHEVNQPLGAAANYLTGAARLLETIAAGATFDDRRERARDGVERAARQVERAGDVLRRLREFLGAGISARQPEPLNEVVGEALEMALAGCVDDRLEIFFRPASGLGEVVMDRVQVQQVVVNLARNAVEAMRDLRSDQRRVLSLTAVALDADMVEVRVTDTGPGLSPDMALHLFEPFQTTKPGGMGIGLSICRSIVESHGGRIAGEPGPAGGTVFWFTLARKGGLASAEQSPRRVVGE